MVSSWVAATNRISAPHCKHCIIPPRPRYTPTLT
jgi:hypothetical protein